MSAPGSLPNAPVALGPNQPARFYRGGAGIARFRGVPQPSDYVPEDWVGSTTEIFSQPGAGLTRLPGGETLRHAIAAAPAAFLGPSHVARYGADPGLLVKILDTDGRLVVHFHPEREFAASHLGSRHGKTEAWIILATRREGKRPATSSSRRVSAPCRRRPGTCRGGGMGAGPRRRQGWPRRVARHLADWGAEVDDAER